MTSFSSANSLARPLGATDRLRVKQAARLARVSPGTIYVWIHENRFRTWIVTRRGFQRGLRFIDRASFEEFLQSQRDQAPDAKTRQSPQISEPTSKDSALTGKTGFSAQPQEPTPTATSLYLKVTPFKKIYPLGENA